jgi:hypothetical protein
MITWAGVEEIVRDSREVHEMMLRASNIQATKGTCLYASFVLCMFLEKFGQCEAVVRGGDGQLDGGAVDTSGIRHGHYWVEGTTPDGIEFVADVTADQFGHPPVYFDRVENSRGRYVPGDDADVQAAVQSLAESVAASMYAC